MATITPKQEAFARGIISGLNPSEAYKAAGYKVGNSATVATEAQRLLHNPNITPIIEAGRREAMTNAVWNRSIAIERLQTVNDKLYKQIEEGEDMSSATLRAFFDSTKLLNDLADVDHEKKLRRDMVEEETCEIREGGMFDFTDVEKGSLVRPGKTKREVLEVFATTQ